MNFDPTADLILRWAWTAAKVAGTEEIGQGHILAAFVIVAKKKDALPALFAAIDWPREARVAAERIERKLYAPASKTPPLPSGITHAFFETHNPGLLSLNAGDLLEMVVFQYGYISVEDYFMVREILQKNSALRPWVELRWQGDGILRAKVDDALKDPNRVDVPSDAKDLLLEVSEDSRRGSVPRKLSLGATMHHEYARSQKLVSQLMNAVVGQDEAVELLGDAYFRASVGQRANGPRGLFTFLGPPGVGKTLLAEAFAKALAAMESHPVGCKVFHMSTMAGHQNFEQLFGAESYYVGNQMGTLTGFVKENPQSVILFDEIEKAHPKAIQSLLPVLDRGEAPDKNLRETISFSECWILFTTNLGGDLWRASGGGALLTEAARYQEMAWDILRNSPLPGGQGDGGHEDQPALSPEFVSRLAKGRAIFFRRLNTEDLQTIVNGTVEREFARIFDSYELQNLRVSMDVASLRLFLLSMAPGVDARRAASLSEALPFSILDQARQDGALMPNAPPPPLTRIMASEEASRSLAEELSLYRPLMLLVDDDDYLVPPIEAKGASIGLTLRRVTTPEEADTLLGQRIPDLVFLDMTINEGATSARVVSAMALLAFFRERLPHVPVYLFSENYSQRGEDFDRVIRSVLKNRGAREFIAYSFSPKDQEGLDAFADRVVEIGDSWRFDQVLRTHERTNITSKVEIRCRLGGDGGNVLGVEVGSLQASQAPFLPDVLSGNFVEGIPRERFSDVIGLSRAKERLQAVLEWLRDSGRLGRFGLKPPRGYLLAGPPGTGKTMLAKALAGEAGLPFLAVAPGQLQNRWIGETERHIRNLFDQAERYAPSIVFIDEIDALATDRTEYHDSRGRSTLSQLLVCLDGVQSPSRPVFVLAATNDPSSLDQAILRPGRMDEVIPVDPPNLEARSAFFALRLRALPWEGTAEAVEHLARATSGCSPAQMDQMLRETGYLLAREGRDTFTKKDILRMVHQVMYGAGNPDIRVNEEERRNAAWHEAGHALIARVLLPRRRVDYLTIIPNDQGGLGLTGCLPEDEIKGTTAQDVLSQMAVSLGGRAAELLRTGSREGVTGGCSSDLVMASQNAFRAITALGLDQEFGPVSLSGIPASARTALEAKASERVLFWLREAESLANKVLSDHVDKLEALAEALLKAETMDGEAIEKALER